MLLKLHQVKMKCLGVERKQDRKKTSDLNSREDKNHIHVFFIFFNVYNNFTFNGVRVSLWCFYFSESLFISCFFCSSCRTHTHTVCVCVLCRLCIVHCRTDVTTAGSSCESTCEAHVCVVFRYLFCMWRLRF